MLVLSRKTGTSIIISENIIVKILDFPSRYCVKLGITAPKEIKILRDELCPYFQDYELFTDQ